MENIKKAALKSANSRGFTLIELMVVIVILGILAVIIEANIRDAPNEAKIAKAKITISALETALELYNRDNGRFPTSEEGLLALVECPASAKKWREGGYLKKGKVPKDPWENEYVYLSPGNGGHPYDITSYGADGTPGGEGFHMDINCWELE